MSYKEHPIACIKRSSTTAKWLGKLLRQNGYWIEQMSFGVGMIPSLMKYKPKVIYYSDFVLGTFLWHLRNWFKFKYQLLYSNGAPNGPPFTRMDHVHQLLPMYIQQALKAGTPAHKMSLLPYAIEMNIVHKQWNKNELRKLLNLPIDKKIIISVGAINSHHKRMDYVIQEFCYLPQRHNYFLLIIGAMNEESETIKQLAKATLQIEEYSFLSVQQEEVYAYLSAADYFILASLHEGLPRVLPEALSVGLLPIVHNYSVTKETLGQYGVFINAEHSNQLSEAIKEIDRLNINQQSIKDFAFQNYSWQQLAPAYEKMITNLLE